MRLKQFDYKRALLTIICIGCLGLAAMMLYGEYREREAARRADAARLLYESTLPPETEGWMDSPSPPPASAPTPPPPLDKPKEIRPFFTALMEEYGNTDIVGFLSIEGTSIHYPVVRSVDNYDYLETDLYGRYDPAGSIFMDMENDIELPDKNVILYGHNMRSNTKFHAVRNYRDERFFKRHPLIRFDTLYADQMWEIFSFYSTSIRFPYTQVFFDSDESFYDLVRQMKERSLYDTGVTVSPDDRILTLSTCTNIDPDTRYVIHARLITPDEE